MSPTRLFLILTAPFLPAALVSLWIRQNLSRWYDDSVDLSLLTRMLIASDNFLTRYGSVVGMLLLLLAPLVAVGVERLLIAVDAPVSSVGSTVRSLGAWLLATSVLTLLAVVSVALGGVETLGAAGFLAWCAIVAFALALAYTFRLQALRFRTGRSRLRPRWLVALAFALNFFVFPLAAYLFAAGLGVWSRHESRTSEQEPYTGPE